MLNAYIELPTFRQILGLFKYEIFDVRIYYDKMIFSKFIVSSTRQKIVISPRLNYLKTGVKYQTHIIIFIFILSYKV